LNSNTELNSYHNRCIY